MPLMFKVGPRFKVDDLTSARNHVLSRAVVNVPVSVTMGAGHPLTWGAGPFMDVLMVPSSCRAAAEGAGAEPPSQSKATSR